MSGAGLSGFGTSFAGYGEVSTNIPSNKTVLIDKFTGKSGNTRFIDPLTKDYQFNEQGYAVGGNGIQQLVYLAILTVKNSSVIKDFGQGFTSVKTLGSNYKTLITNEVNNALSDLVKKKLIELVSVDISTAGTTSRIIIQWKNLKNNDLNTITI
jgi:hypothetical protein